MKRFASVIVTRFRNERCLGDLSEYDIFKGLSDIIKPEFLAELEKQAVLSEHEEVDAHIWTTIKRLASILEKRAH